MKTKLLSFTDTELSELERLEIQNTLNNYNLQFVYSNLKELNANSMLKEIMKYRAKFIAIRTDTDELLLAEMPEIV